MWPSGEVDYDLPSGFPVVALAVPATMNEMPLDAPETAEAEEAAPAASKAEDGEKRLIQPQKKQLRTQKKR